MMIISQFAIDFRILTGIERRLAFGLDAFFHVHKRIVVTEEQLADRSRGTVSTMNWSIPICEELKMPCYNAFVSSCMVFVCIYYFVIPGRFI